MFKITEDPIVVFIESNDDGTKDADIGSFSPFNVIVTSNSFASVIPAEHTDVHFYSFGETLPSDVDVEVSR